MEDTNILNGEDFDKLNTIVKSTLLENEAMSKLIKTNDGYKNVIKKVSSILDEKNKSVSGLTNHSKYSKSITCELDYITDDNVTLLEKIESNKEFICAINKAIEYNNLKINKPIRKFTCIPLMHFSRMKDKKYDGRGIDINKLDDLLSNLGFGNINKPIIGITVPNGIADILNGKADVVNNDTIEFTENANVDKCKVCPLNEYCVLKGKGKDYIIANCCISTIKFK